MTTRLYLAFSLALLATAMALAAHDARDERAAPVAGAAPATPSPDLAAAAGRLLAALDEEARAVACFPFESDERFAWHFIPKERRGLALGRMTTGQRELAFQLLAAALSRRGLEKTTGVIELERILGELSGNRAFRDPEKYYLTLFGAPGGDAPWGFRFEGHHISLNFTSADSGERAEVSGTPAFFGANPARVPSGPSAGLRLLAAEEDLARELLRSLDAGQRARAVLAETAPTDILTGNHRHARLAGEEATRGLPRSAMNEGQQKLLRALVAAYLDDLESKSAAREWRRLAEAGEDELLFAWAGGGEPGQGHYYRIVGPTLLIEYDNTQNDANHVHKVLRGMDGDFGEDLLKKHYEESDHHR